MQLMSARGAQKEREGSKKLSMYSKQWLPGDTLRVFYPIYWQDGQPEIAVGAIWGHSVGDIKALGLKTSFIPSTTDFDQNGQPVGQPDVTYQFSQIARIFVNGAKANEEAAIMRKNWPSEAARLDALKTLETKYDTKNNPDAVKPIIGRVQYYISTEVLSVKIANSVPNLDTIAITSAPLSNKVINKLYQLMDDPKYAPVEGDEFFEVEWKYPVDPKKTASAQQASPNGLTPEYRFAAQFADAYRTVTGMFGMVARDAATITRRATKSVDPARVRAALTQYAFLSSEYLDIVSEEDTETLLRHVDLIHDLDVTRAITNKELVEKIEAALRDLEVNRMQVPENSPSLISEPTTPPVTETASTSTPENPAADVASAETELPDLTLAAGAPTMQSLLNEQPTMSAQSLANNVQNVGADDNMLEDIDLTSMV